MWPRVVEVMLGAWLLATPFIFRHSPEIGEYTLNAFVSGSLIIVASLTAFWRPARYAFLGTLAVALWLGLHGYFSAERPGPPPAQNELIVGILLLLFAILPGEINAPPEPWREHATGDGASRRRPA